MDIKKDWPIAAAVVAGVGAVALYRKGSGGGAAIAPGFGGPSAEAAQISVAQIQAQQAEYQTLVTEFGATERVRLEAQAVTEAERLKAQTAQQQAATSSFGSIVTAIIGLFSWEATARAVKYREAAVRYGAMRPFTGLRFQSGRAWEE